jgi:hypothetical protein
MDDALVLTGADVLEGQPTGRSRVDVADTLVSEVSDVLG